MSSDHDDLPQFGHVSALTPPGTSGILDPKHSFRHNDSGEHRNASPPPRRAGPRPEQDETSMAQDAKQPGAAPNQGSQQQQQGGASTPVQQQSQTPPPLQIIDLASI
jgi:hypothetical protein